MSAATEPIPAPDSEFWALGRSYEEWFGPAGNPAGPALTAEIEIGNEVPTALYRLFAVGGKLLYVGITSDLAMRLAKHAADKEWWPEVARKTAVLYPCRRDALAAEAQAIHDEDPVHNRQRPEPRPALELPADEEPGTRDDIGGLLFFFRSITRATQTDLAAWQTRMALTGAGTLGEVILTMAGAA